MIYYVIELQTSTTSGATLCTSYTDRDTAEQAYHTVLADAAVSSVYRHGAMLVNQDMFVIKSECYQHDVPVNAEE